jgi:hypothetical protein
LSTSACREADHAPSGVHQAQIAFDVDKNSLAVVVRSDQFCRKETAARPTCVPSGVHQAQIAFDIDKNSLAIVVRSDQFCRKETAARPTCVPSGVHQAQIAFDVDKNSLAVCREATIRTKRPSGNWTAFSFKGE